MYSILIFLLGITNAFGKDLFGDFLGMVLASTHFDPFKRFPHYVTISTGAYRSNNCSGSIISDRWILTSLGCAQGERLSVYFLLDDQYSPRDSFSVTVDYTSVVPYPTLSDNVALIKLPIVLPFSERLAPISYPSQYDVDMNLENMFAVMPGFNLEGDSSITYEMYKILSSQNCSERLGQRFDDYMEICAVDWNENYSVVKGANPGSGLIVGWPRKPLLVGILNDAAKGNWYTPAVYAKLSDYSKWIDETIGRRFTPTTEQPHTSKPPYWATESPA